MIFGVIFLLLCSLLSCCVGQYEIPNPRIEAYAVKGFRASIPDSKGMQLYGFHANLNTEITSTENGQYWKDILKPTNGQWVFEDVNAKLKVGDIINFYIFVQHDKLGYRKEDGTFVITDLLPGSITTAVSPTTRPGTATVRPGVTPRPGSKPVTPVPAVCNPSVTKVNGVPACQGQLIFEDLFDTLDTAKWTRECRMPIDDQDNEFVSYQHSATNAYIQNGKLFIMPTLLDPNPDSDLIQTGSLNLTQICGCSETSSGMACYREGESYNIVPPVVSASFKSKAFNFLYGRVEIRAKLPKGDWLYPALYLEPKQKAYGPAYNSGLMRVAFARGNVILSSSTGRLIDGRELSGGLLLAQFPPARNYSTRTYIGNTQWSDDFHTYELIWQPEKVQMKVDGTLYATVTPPANGFKSMTEPPYSIPYAAGWVGEKLSPFDKEARIQLGVGVGGVTDFPDNSMTRDAEGLDHIKPWRNLSPKAMLRFWEDVANWSSSWQGDEPALQVEHVKVYAL